MNAHRDPEEHRAEILARRSRIRANTAQLPPTHRMVGAEVYGPLEHGSLYELREGMLLEVAGRYRYDRRIEAVGAKRNARTRLTVIFGGEGFTARWDIPVSFRRLLPEEHCDDCGAPFFRMVQDGPLCPACASYAEASKP